MDGWGEEVALADLMDSVNFPVPGIAVPLVAALELVTAAPRNFQWIRVDWNPTSPRVFLDREQARLCRADALLLLAAWAVGTAIPQPAAIALFRTHSQAVADLDDAGVDVIAALAGMNLLDGDRDPVTLGRLAEVIPVPAELIESRLLGLERLGLITAGSDGWLLQDDPPRQQPAGPDTYMTNLGTMSVLVMDGMAESRRLEGWGLHLVKTTNARLQESLPETRDQIERVTAVQPPVLGPGFDYASSRRVFGGRTGSGPLYVAWDTNLLIHYFDHGAALWRGGQLPDSLNAGHNYEVLEGLELLLALSVVRDIRMVLLPHVLDDAKKALSQARQTARLRALERFEAALSLVEAGEAEFDLITREGLLLLPPQALEEALLYVPTGGDRRLVSEAVERGVHVFLTNDTGVLRARSRLALFGLYITNPQELLEDLVAAGAYNCLFVPETMYWSLPDQQRIANLIEALPTSDL